MSRGKPSSQNQPLAEPIAGNGLRDRRVFLTQGLALTAYTSSVAQETPNLGHPATPAEIAGWDISIPPNGTGLPPGSQTTS